LIAQRNRFAKTKELCLNVHGSRPHTSMARQRRTVNSASANRRRPALVHA